MVKTALVSKHIVLTCPGASKPVYGVVCIEDERIVEVVQLPEDLSVHEALTKFACWNPVDCSDYYILPGLIDLSVRAGWESDSLLTQAAVAGVKGVEFC